MKWYIDVFEGGFNTKTIMKDFVLAQVEIKKHKEDAIRTKKKFEKELEKKGQQFIETKNALRKL